MPKPHTFPILYDEARTLGISFLSKHGYLRPNQCQSGIITWSWGGYQKSSISVTVNTGIEDPYLELDYEYNQTRIVYRVFFVSAPSNLGKGLVWYFLCPNTGKRCRKLYLVRGYFLHRLAFTGCMYSKQTLSKRGRMLDRQIATAFGSDDLYNQLYRKHSKKQYAGKPTKRYLKLTKRIEQGDRFSVSDLEKFLIGKLY
jgi:hypothetical protein